MQVAFPHFGQFFAFVSFTNHGNLNVIHVVAYLSTTVGHRLVFYIGLLMCSED